MLAERSEAFGNRGEDALFADEKTLFLEAFFQAGLAEPI